MSRRFRLYSWLTAALDMLIGFAFYSAHPAMQQLPSSYYLFLFIPWWVWSSVFFFVGVGISIAIYFGNHRQIRRIACISVVATLMWALEYALLLPSVLRGQPISWMGLIIIGGIAGFELLYLGMPASPWLDEVEEGLPAEYLVGR